MTPSMRHLLTCAREDVEQAHKDIEHAEAQLREARQTLARARLRLIAREQEFREDGAAPVPVTR